MTETEDFLASVLPRFKEAEIALHNGDAGPRKAMWSRSDPVTVFGAVLSCVGWNDTERTFDALAERFSDCVSYDNEVVAAGASCDLGYVVAIEHTTASVAGAPPEPYTLRVTTVYRREDGAWKAVHRHADPVPDSSRTQTDRLKEDLER